LKLTEPPVGNGRGFCLVEAEMAFITNERPRAWTKTKSRSF
jgi:hypothetical protein